MLLVWQNASLICVTWLPVSNRAVTGCPLIMICSSLALPINFVQGLLGFCVSPFSSLIFKVSVLDCPTGECLSRLIGLLMHSPFGTAPDL